MTFWCGSGSEFFLQWLQGCKKIIFIHIFSYNLPAGTLSSGLKTDVLAKILCYNFILQALFQSAQHLYVKREGSGSGSELLTSGSGSGRPKHMRILIQIQIPNTGYTGQILIHIPKFLTSSLHVIDKSGPGILEPSQANFHSKKQKKPEINQ